MPDVVVVGAGVNGLVAGGLLAMRKLTTVILDQRPSVGGAAVTSEIAPGFRVPRLSHAVGPVRRDVVRALRLDRAPGLEFLTPDPSLTTLGERGRTIVFHPDPVLTAGAINAVSPHDAGRWREFLQVAHQLARVVASVNRHPPPSIDARSAADLWHAPSARPAGAGAGTPGTGPACAMAVACRSPICWASGSTATW